MQLVTLCFFGYNFCLCLHHPVRLPCTLAKYNLLFSCDLYIGNPSIHTYMYVACRSTPYWQDGGKCFHGHHITGVSCSTAG